MPTIPLAMLIGLPPMCFIESTIDTPERMIALHTTALYPGFSDIAPAAAAAAIPPRMPPPDLMPKNAREPVFTHALNCERVGLRPNNDPRSGGNAAAMTPAMESVFLGF